MHKVERRRLLNEKTGKETGFEFVRTKINLLTPLGKKVEKGTDPFFPGEEDLLELELDNVQAFINCLECNSKEVGEIQEILHCLKDITRSIERATKDVLTEVELFEIKSLLLSMDKLRGILLERLSGKIPEEFIPVDITEPLDVLDPKGDRINTFYIYDDYSERLAKLRTGKKELDREIRRIQKENQANSIAPVQAEAAADAVDALIGERDQVALEIEEEEYRVREELSHKIGEHSQDILVNCYKIGRLDYVLAKAIFANKYSCVRPKIAQDHIIEINGGRQLQVEEILNLKGKKYMPVSLKLSEGVTCITGANMGGKTISLKLSGLIPIMAQHGYFVPCESAEIGLSNYIRILIGDSQSLERGLSSFGSEMEELKEILNQAADRSLILIDEIASGTNPVEGLALTRSIVDYMAEKPYIVLLTTHYEMVTNDRKIRNLQVKGLADVNFRNLNSELSLATTQRARIDIIGNYMDYHLIEVDSEAQVPKDAINIANMLGLPDIIIEKANEYLMDEKE